MTESTRRVSERYDSVVSSAAHSTRQSDVADDLTCAFCGYNLRGQRTDGVCTECGSAICDATVPFGLRFSSFRAIRRTRLGVVLWIISLMLPALGMLTFSVAAFISPAYWSELTRDRQSGFSRLYRAAVQAWFWAPAAAALFYVAAVLVITAPLRRGVERFRPLLGLVAATLVLTSVGYLLPSEYASSMALSVPLWQVMAWAIALGLYGLSQCLLWVYLIARIGPSCRRLRRVMWVALAAPAALAAGRLLYCLASRYTAWERFGSGPRVYDREPEWWEALADLWSDGRGAAVLAIIMVAALWIYLRRLNAALPRKSKTAARVRVDHA